MKSNVPLYQRDRRFEKHIENLEKVLDWVNNNHIFTKSIVKPAERSRAFGKMRCEIESVKKKINEVPGYAASAYSPYKYDWAGYYDRGDAEYVRFTKQYHFTNRDWADFYRICGHHWEYWVMIKPDPVLDTPYTILEIPEYNVIIMLCVWWSYSWEHKNLLEIFDWYEKHKESMLLHPNTRKLVEEILNKIGEKLQGKSKEDGK